MFVEGTDFQKLYLGLLDVSHRLQAVKDRPSLASVVSRDLLIPTPKIVVIGEQSAGKSTVVQRLCEIPLPADKGVCTRCPTEIRLYKGQDGTVQNRDPGAQLAKYRITCKLPARAQLDPSSSDLERWVVEENDSTKVHLHVAAAQKMVLEKDPQCRGLTAEEKFSMGVAIVEVFDAPVNLTLVDLPGLIAYDDAHPQNHDRILQITQAYIQDPSNIVVIVTSSNEQLVSKQVFKTLKEAAIRYNRPAENNICLVTKADLTGGNPMEWIAKVVEVGHSEHKLIPKGNWFLVASIDRAGAAASGTENIWQVMDSKEKEVFTTMSPWCEMPYKTQLEDCWGINCIKKALSDRLYKLLKQSADDMNRVISVMQASIVDAMDKLPPYAEVTRATSEVRFRNIVNTVCNHIRHDILLGPADSLSAAPILKDQPLGSEIRIGLEDMANGMSNMAKTAELGKKGGGGISAGAADHDALTSAAASPTAENLSRLLKHVNQPWNPSPNAFIPYLTGTWTRGWYLQANACCDKIFSDVMNLVKKHVCEIVIKEKMRRAELADAIEAALMRRLNICFVSAKQQLLNHAEMEFGLTFSSRQVANPYTVGTEISSISSGTSTLAMIASAASASAGVKGPTSNGGASSANSANPDLRGLDTPSEKSYVHDLAVKRDLGDLFLNIKQTFAAMSSRYAHTAALIMRHHLLGVFVREVTHKPPPRHWQPDQLSSEMFHGSSSWVSDLMQEQQGVGTLAAGSGSSAWTMPVAKYEVTDTLEEYMHSALKRMPNRMLLITESLREPVAKADEKLRGLEGCAQEVKKLYNEIAELESQSFLDYITFASQAFDAKEAERKEYKDALQKLQHVEAAAKDLRNGSLHAAEGVTQAGA